LISAIGLIPDVRKAVTMDLKKPGSLVYVVGETLEELGGSHYLLVNNKTGGRVPGVNVKKARKSMDSLVKAMDSGLVLSCHDCSEGGMGVAASEMAFAGEIGIKIDLKKVPSKTRRADFTLFSETNSRFLVEVKEKNKAKFEKTMTESVVKEIGRTLEKPRLIVKEKNVCLDERLEDLKNAWEGTFKW
jgi:phosphoribosylformylglycinamidine synthase